MKTKWKYNKHKIQQNYYLKMKKNNKSMIEFEFKTASRWITKKDENNIILNELIEIKIKWNENKPLFKLISMKNI